MREQQIEQNLAKAVKAAGGGIHGVVRPSLGRTDGG